MQDSGLTRAFERGFKKWIKSGHTAVKCDGKISWYAKTTYRPSSSEFRAISKLEQLYVSMHVTHVVSDRFETSFSGWSRYPMDGDRMLVLQGEHPS